jgi:pectate lyase
VNYCLKKKYINLFVIIFMILSGFHAKAFDIIPNLKGFGNKTRAAYGGNDDPVILIVTNLEHKWGSLKDDFRGGVPVKTGTLLACLSYTPPENTGKIILFEVSGTIAATTEPFSYNVKHRYTVIAGQTAPSPGITLKNIKFGVQVSDVLIQHLRIRIGDNQPGYDPENRGVVITGPHNITNVVFDHCSISWGIDENFTVWNDSRWNNSQAYKLENITLSNSIVSEALNNSIHPKGPHSMGPTIGYDTQNISLIRNLFAHNHARNPYLRSTKIAVVNNLVYNAKEPPGGIRPVFGPIEASFVGNVIRPGPDSGSTSGCVASFHGWKNDWYNNGVGSKVYTHDNITVNCDRYSGEWVGVQDANNYRQVSGLKALSPPVWPSILKALDSKDVEKYVLANAGARPFDRDEVDIRIINDVKNSTGRIIDSQKDVDGWPVLRQNKRRLDIPLNPHKDNDGDGYTNLEEWLHKLSGQSEISPPNNFRKK